MINRQNHIIDKIHLEVKTTSESSANYIKNNVDRFLKDVVLSKLENLLDEYELNNKTVRFNEIHLNFFISEWNNEREIVHALENSLRNELEKELNILQAETRTREIKKEIPAKQNREDVLLFFLENSFLPWYGKDSYISELIKPDNWNQSIGKKSFRKKLTILFMQSENALTRFALQFPAVAVIDYLVAIQPEKKELSKGIRSLLDSFPEKEHSHLILLLLQLAVLKENEKVIQKLYSLASSFSKSEKNAGNLEFENAFRKLLKFIANYYPENKEVKTKIQSVLKEYQQNELQKHLEKFSEKREEKFAYEEQQLKKETNDLFFKEKKTEIIVQNAGLILLHPFLKTFFTETGIISKERNFPIEDQMLAVHSLHYLATGNEDFFEASGIFEKYLTGVPLKMPVQRESLLTHEIKTEANEMLGEVIKNWPALKNTSPDGLRQMFLQRDGKLIKKEENYRLLVERKTQDILLEKLSWNISVVKLKWLEKLLFVEW